MPVTPDLQEMLETRARERIGKTLRDKYRLDRVLGVGGMAAVYAATHRNGNEVALKLLHPELAFHPSERSRFLREGYAANLVKHSGAVSVIDDDITEDDWAFLVMELLHGKTVEELWESRALRLAPGLVVAITLGVLDVIEAAHAAGVVHRDLKPANLFLTNDGELKVLDFGIARVRDLSGHRTTNVGTVVGTPSFMAPEQAMGRSKEVDERTDLWAIGSVGFALLVGDVVHPAESAQETLILAATERSRRLGPLVPSLPGPIAAVFDQALAFEKRERWPSATAMRAALVAASQEAYGEVPGRAVLRKALAQSAALRRPSPDAETVDLPHADTELPPEPAPSPPQPAILEVAETPRPQSQVMTGIEMLPSSPAIELAPPPLVLPKRWRVGRTWVVGGVALLLGAFLVLRAGTAPVADAAQSPRAMVGSLLTLDSPESRETEAPMTAVQPLPTPSPEEPAPNTVEAPTSKDPPAKGEASSSAAVRSKVSPVATPTTSTVHTVARSVPPSCTPPFVIQPKTGRKIWKLECL